VGLTASAGASETLLVWNQVAVAVGCTDLGCFDEPMGIRALRVTADGHPIRSSFEMVPGDPRWEIWKGERVECAVLVRFLG
jgi:hypothetical protein